LIERATVEKIAKNHDHCHVFEQKAIPLHSTAISKERVDLRESWASRGMKCLRPPAPRPWIEI
jgi:hypothetical protein